MILFQFRWSIYHASTLKKLKKKKQQKRDMVGFLWTVTIFRSEERTWNPEM